ncbi:MAG: type II toxin-antitoxin system HicB family antitoxin [Anaerolineales bacterium]|nr:type II toxin-antitoxin system HicB family antitoxin [Anaerolineales bacterium]
MIRYKNYVGVVEYDDEGKIFTGEVIGLRDVVTFQGRTAAELEKSFRQSVDLYLEMCKRDGVEPQKPFSGRFNLRLDPELHRQLAERAALEKISLNEYVAHVLREAV